MEVQIAELKYQIEKSQPSQPQIKLEMESDDADRIKPINLNDSYFFTNDGSFAMNKSIKNDRFISDKDQEEYNHQNSDGSDSSLHKKPPQVNTNGIGLLKYRAASIGMPGPLKSDGEMQGIFDSNQRNQSLNTQLTFKMDDINHATPDAFEKSEP